uniref:Uncharacterized protein n=1 Tax=Globodera rostochiensis TaxID=31243 RepID=A0A914HU31_GLORO
MLCESSWNPVCAPFSEIWDTDHVANCTTFNQCASEWYWSSPTKKHHRPNAAGGRLPVAAADHASSFCSDLIDHLCSDS